MTPGRRLLRALLAAIPILLLWLLLTATATDPVLGSGLARQAIQAAAIIGTTMLGVFWLASLMIAALERPGRRLITGLERVAIFGLLGFAATFLTLRYFGFDVGTILTTSALVTAAIGLAMQPTLSSVIAGLALNTDRELHIGDTVMQDGRPVSITGLGWRVAVGKRGDGTVVVIPNAKLSDSPLEIVPRNQPLRVDFACLAPPGCDPRTACALAEDVAARLPGIDAGKAVEALADAAGMDGGISQLRVRLWLLPPYDRQRLQGLFLERFWYACRRHGLAESKADMVQTGREAAAMLGLSKPAGDQLAQQGQLLVFAPGERLALPPRFKDFRLLLLRGGALADGDAGEDHVPAALAAARLTSALGDLIGPYAVHAARQAADAPDRAAFGAALAAEIDDEAERVDFLRQAGLDRTRLNPGASLKATQDASGLFTCGDLAADGETAILAIPSGLALN